MTPAAFVFSISSRSSFLPSRFSNSSSVQAEPVRRPPLVVARAPTRRPENVPGNVFVDKSCIDCDTCRWVAPKTFHIAGDQSAVHAQPETRGDILAAMKAAAACPTGSIRTEEPEPLAKEAALSFPQAALDAAGQPVPNVFYNGFASKDTFGASSWLITTPRGNIMFDCPRFFEPLVKKIESMGGIKYLVLSHRDDVAGHDRWAERMGCERVIHAGECTTSQKTDECEIKLTDSQLPYELLPGLTILHVPGHTQGSIALHYKDSTALFTGDHLALDSRTNKLSAFPVYCKYSWEVQMDSVRKLADVDFLHAFPGHGRAFHFKDADERKQELLACADAMSGVPA